MSADPSSPATVENRANISVFFPGCRKSALVHLGVSASSKTSKVPWAPEPLAWTTRSGTRSRLNWAIFWIR